MVSAADMRQSHQAGRWAREAHRGREAAPLYEMGQDGTARRRQWQAGWDERDQELNVAHRKNKRSKR